MLADAGNDVTLWARRDELAEQINASTGTRTTCPSIDLPAELRATHDAAARWPSAELVAIAMPSQTLRANLVRLGPPCPPDATLISLMKGVELGTTKRMSEVIAEVAGTAPSRSRW